jgi:predicted GIY-YIG superfamily endonuclease
MTARKRPLSDLSGYVYVVAFSHGTVKVGQTTDIGGRLAAALDGAA